MRLFERLQREDRIAEREKRALRDFASDAASQRRLEKMSTEALRLAAALRSHEGELGYVGRATEYELRRRGIKL